MSDAATAPFALRASDALPAAPKPPGLTAPGSFWPLCVAVVVLPLLAAGGAAWSSWFALKEDIESRLIRTVDLLHENTLRALESQEAYITAVNRFILGWDWDTIAASADLADFLARLRDSAPGTSALGIVSPDGMLLHISSSPFPAQPVDLSGRDYFQAHQGARVDEVEPVVGAAIIGRIRGRRIFPISHARRDREGSPDGGVIWATLDVDAFASFYASIVISPTDEVQLIRHDGRVLVRHPSLPEAPAVDAGAVAERRAVIATAAQTGRAALAYIGAGTAGAITPGAGLPILARPFLSALGLPAMGAERLVATRWLPRYGIAVIYGLQVEQMRHVWARRAAGFTVAAGVVVVLLLALIRLAQIGMQREYAALARARAEAERRLDAEIRLHRTARITALGQVAAGVAHDMNNLIQSVMAASRLIDRRAEQPEKVRSLCVMLQETASRGARIAGRMLEFSRQRPGGAHVPQEGFALSSLFDRLGDLLGDLLGSGIHLTCTAEPGLPPLSADRNEFETVLVNLIVNARDAMPDGGAVRLKAELERRDDGSRRLRVSVTDSGIGMTPEVLGQAGEPFFTTKEAGRGTGLGLSMARQFAEGLGGGLEIDSAPGQGTRVSLWFPVASDTASG
ncbi:ATP-binding protein [Falsiroseomonas selenitidurans]|uniref:histidine kinase n=1 Tax=Falsiroseomonas selenitidurans TaxID=2716335 RepID=A0ABX1ECN4_9PROT|nr:ATP-binding protein [Falsiroseomonas selenitidurans]NKC34575.1 hypothetical protein [Falsiroseomonas selenitidurans]